MHVTWDFFIRVSAEILSSAFDSKLCSMPDDKIKIQYFDKGFSSVFFQR